MSSALVLISHDRRFLSRLSKTTVWLDRGMTRRIERGFAQFEAWRDETLEQEDRDRHKLDRKIAMEEDWLRHGVSARRKRNQGRLEGLQELRKQRREQRRAAGKAAMSAQASGLSGDRVVEAKAIWKSYGAETIVKDFSTRILRGDRVGIVGRNGAGKTTLIRLLTGKLAPDQGEVKLGVNLAISELDQGRAALDPEATLAATLTDGRGDTVRVGGEARHVVTYMKDFLFSPEQARTPVRVLSGGERGRLLLAKSLAKPSNLLVLDEPTNDLDLETLDVLQEMLADYAGTVLVVSHDRDFLDRVATSIVMAEGDGRFVEYAGGYSDMVAQRGEGVAAKVEKEPARDQVCAARASVIGQAPSDLHGETRARNAAGPHRRPRTGRGTPAGKALRPRALCPRPQSLRGPGGKAGGGEGRIGGRRGALARTGIAPPGAGRLSRMHSGQKSKGTLDLPQSFSLTVL